MADQDRATATDPGVAEFQGVAEEAMAAAARTVHEQWLRRWDAVVVPLASAARDVVDNVAMVQGLAEIPEAVFAAVCRLERAAAAVDSAGADARHDVEISIGPDGVGWACGTCAWVGRGLANERAAQQEHDQIAADIASGKLPPPDTSKPAGRLEPAAADASTVAGRSPDGEAR